VSNELNRENPAVTASPNVIPSNDAFVETEVFNDPDILVVSPTGLDKIDRIDE
jgi:hypothetical protein